jgi:hypothetical protein
VESSVQGARTHPGSLSFGFQKSGPLENGHLERLRQVQFAGLRVHDSCAMATTGRAWASSSSAKHQEPLEGSGRMYYARRRSLVSRPDLKKSVYGLSESGWRAGFMVGGAR